MRTPSESILRQIRQTWNLSTEFQFIRKVENWIYKDEQNQIFIRITEPTHRRKSQLESELDWMLFLQQGGINFAHPIPSEKGNLVEAFSDENEEFYVSVFKKANGIPLIAKEDFTPNRLKNWGKLIGTLHSATINYTRPIDIKPRPEWNRERSFYYNREIFSPFSLLHSRYQILEDWLHALPQTKQNYGLIHADIHQGNFFVDEKDNFTLFDFDDCHYSWFAYDIAVPLFGLSMSMRNKCSQEDIEQIHQHLLAGYRRTGVLSEKDLCLVDHFILYRHFVIYSFARKNLKNNTLSENTKDWMHMAIKYCGDFIENYDFSSL